MHIFLYTSGVYLIEERSECIFMYVYILVCVCFCINVWCLVSSVYVGFLGGRSTVGLVEC